MSQINESAIRTPGVYTTEIPSFPPSIAQVQTAIPAFIGYTERAQRGNTSLTLKPTKISSMLDYRELFGGAFIVKPADFTLSVNRADNVVAGLTYTNMYYMFEALRLFFDNGGGYCYIVSVGNYSDDVILGDESAASPTVGLHDGLKAVEIYDEPTLLLFPDAVRLEDAPFFALQQMALEQCRILQDRFCIFDTRENNAPDIATWQTSVDNFRNNIGINSLSYGACYTPWLASSYIKDIDFALLQDHVFDTASTPVGIDLTTLTADSTINDLVITLQNTLLDRGAVNTAINTLQTSSFPSIMDKYNKLRNDVIISTVDTDTKHKFSLLLSYLDTLFLALPPLRASFILTSSLTSRLRDAFDGAAKNTNTGLARYLKDYIGFAKNSAIDAIKETDTISDFGTAYDTLLTGWTIPAPNTIATFPANPKEYTTVANPVSVHNQVLAMIRDIDPIMNGLDAFISSIQTAVLALVKVSQEAVYRSHPVISSWVKYLQNELSKLPPSGAIAGIYAAVDGSRGVWKAPANVSINSVVGPTQIIDDRAQGTLNVDDVAGKSINVIRSFIGKGTLVWGARTLDGYSNEWRYVSVRRLFIMVEESAKKATFPFVFEPNDANTWVKVRSMIENYLTMLWRQGALAGAKPAHAFYVHCGLGQTMTAQDILDGKLIVEIGLAAVRPAEFIILRFSHKLQES